MFLGVVEVKAFLLIAFWLLRIVKGSTDESVVNIVFGSFGDDDDDRKASSDVPDSVPVIESADRAPAEVIAPSFVPAKFANIRGDQLNKLKKFEQAQRKRFNQTYSIPGVLNLRLGKDYFLDSVSNYSLEALYACLRYLELPLNWKDNANTKINTLKVLFELNYNAHQGLSVLANSFLHPICVDAMKYLSDSLQPHQINWLMENAPGALFDNFELITTLRDYSFLTLEIYERNAVEFKTLQAVDFLAIPAFVKTGPVPLIMTFLITAFEPSRHWDILLENRGLADLLKDQGVTENPLHYPFLVGIADTEYLLSVSEITKKIRRNGLTRMALASVVAYVQESNVSIQNCMTGIAETWADLHKNLHLGVSPDVNKEFNERIQWNLNNLILARNQREDLNALIKEFEERKIPAHPSIIQACPDWLKSLKILVQTPFDAMMRLSFATRCSPNLMTPIHPDDEGNSVKLPKLILPGMACMFMHPDPAFTFSPLLWSALWRNAFFDNGEAWRHDPELQNLNEKEIEKYLKPKCEVIYRDSNFNAIDLLDAWTSLAAVLPEIYSKGPRLLRFIAAISVPAPPEGFEFSREQLIQRQVFAKKAAAAMVAIRLVDKASVETIKFNMSDSEEVAKLMDELSQIVPNGPQGAVVSIEQLGKYCQKLNSRINNNDTTRLAPTQLFQFLRLMETSFASLGSTLTEAQIKELGENQEIRKFLAFHGRALTRSQVNGLLKSEWGRLFLKTNKPMLAALLDYSSFKPGDFDELGVSVDEVRLNLATAPASAKLLNLAKKGFSNVDDPLPLVYSLGFNLWTDTSNFKSLALWELFNPIVLAYDLEMTADCAFIYHMTGLRPKLHEKVLLEMALVFVAKWLIAQDWYAFVYHMAVSKGVEHFGPKIIARLIEIYPKYLVEGELPGRKDLSEWLQVAEQCRTADGNKSKEDLVSALAALSVAIDACPLTPFREIISQSTSTVSDLLARPFASPTHSPSLLRYVQSLIMNHFKPSDKLVWLNRLDILSQFSPETGKLDLDEGSSALIRTRLSTLPTFDALIYKWALEFEGVCVESIFRDTGRSGLEIDPKASGALSKKQAEEEVKEVKADVKENKKKNKKNKNKK